MGLSACPAAVVATPVEIVWEFLAHPARYAEWIDGQVDHPVFVAIMICSELHQHMKGMHSDA